MGPEDSEFALLCVALGSKIEQNPSVAFERSDVASLSLKWEQSTIKMITSRIITECRM